MRFQPGQSGNPAGRPAGSRNKKTLEMEELLAEQAEAAVRTLLDRARRGEPAALRLCMERVLPTGANRPIAIELPRIDTPDDVAAATRVVTKTLGEGAISARETINLLTIIERLTRLAERVQQMRERHEVWLAPSQASLRDAARAALAAVAEEDEIEDRDLYSPVDSESAAEAEPLSSPVNSAREGAASEAADSDAPGQSEGEDLYSPVNSENEVPGKRVPASAAPVGTEGNGLYFPVNSIENAVADPRGAPGPGSLLKRRRRSLMEGASPAALLIGEQSVDRRSYVTEQTWLEELRETGRPGAGKRSAA
jgi:Family of unknown function (DUF5681)